MKKFYEDENVYVGIGNLDGKAVYANTNFEKGEAVIKYNLNLLSKVELLNLTEHEQSFTHTHVDRIYLYSIPERYVNHSNNPNTYPDLVEQCDIALRPIQKDEMITGDAGKDDCATLDELIATHGVLTNW